MRPDRIVVGEVRRGEALDMIQALTSGHRGSMTTVHASSPTDTCYRLETLALMADIGIPLHALRRQIASALDLIVLTARSSAGHRLVTGVAEVDFDETTQNYRISDIFRLDPDCQEPELTWTRTRPATLTQLKSEGLVREMALTKPMLEV